MTQSPQRERNISCDFGVPDYWRFYLSEYGNIDRLLYEQILDGFNTMLAEVIGTQGYSFDLPCGLGTLEWRKYQAKLDPNNIKESMLYFPVDRKATRDLWNEDREYCEKNNIVVRHLNPETDRYVFRLIYFKSKSKFKNRNIYQLLVNQRIKRQAVEPIRLRIFDAFLNDKYDKIGKKIVNRVLFPNRKFRRDG